MQKKYRLCAALAAVAALCALPVYVYLARSDDGLGAAPRGAGEFTQESHYRHLYKLYAATERHRQYGLTGGNVALNYATQSEFIPIETLTEKMICPKPVKDPPDGFTYFGSRSIVLNRKGRTPLFYSMSYTGGHAFIRDRDWFDLLLDLGALPNAKRTMLSAEQASGLMLHAPLPHTRNGSYFTPFSYNVADVNGDGTDDFFFGGRLYLSTADGFQPIDDKALDGREIVFKDGRFLAPIGDTIEEWALDEDRTLTRKSSRPLQAEVAKNRPFTLLPLAGAVTDRADAIIITASSFDFYALRSDRVERVLSVPLTARHSIIVGARGDFDGDGKDDLWLAESRWKGKAGNIVGRASLLSSRKFTTDAKSIEDLTGFTLYGSARYTDYDGIGASLSPVAGDFDADGKPDLSIPGHVNLNEAGALYILLGKDLNGTSKDVTDKAVIRIAGKPVSNLAPPFTHYDMGSRIIVTADNDLCSGIAGGAIYVLDLSKPTTRLTE